MRKRVELLSPVGNMEMLYAAIHNGADSVYLAGKNYGARKYARNFTNEELIDVIKMAHLYGVRVYVTVNTIIYEEEKNDVIEYIEFLYQHQVDALIMQDIGLISLVRKRCPNLEIHASTQCHNHNEGGLQLFKDLGISRVVLDRELSVEEIRKFGVDIEKEVFIYGALCVSYSGCCLFSSMNGGRSGNRGECAQCCRLPYKEIQKGKVIKRDGDYLLSTRDLNTLNYLGDLIDAGIDCFKIEGRMKSPSYVAYVTRCARRIIDAYYQGKREVLSEIELDNLKKLFYRGFTRGYILNSNNIMNHKSPNHQGIVIGKVINVIKNRVFIKIENDYLYQGDGIRFKNANQGMIVNRLYNKKGLLVKESSKGNVVSVDVREKIYVGDIVLKTIDYKLQEEIFNYPKRRILVNFKVKCHIGEKLLIEIDDGCNKIREAGDVVVESINSSIDKNDFMRQLGKLGNTPFELCDLSIDMDDNVFVRLSVINDIRRKIVDKLIKIREEKRVHEVVIGSLDKRSVYDRLSVKKKITVLVQNRCQLEVCLNYEIDSIYVNDYDLYLEYKDRGNIYYKVSRVNYEMKKYLDEKLLVGDMGSIYKYSSSNEVVSDYYLNVVNYDSVNFYKDLGVKRVTLSVELNDYQINDLLKYVDNDIDIEMFIYGRVELMIIKNGHSFILLDKKHYKFPVVFDGRYSHVYQHEVVDKIFDIDKYMKMWISCFRIEFFDETIEEVKTIFKRVFHK